jgi:hypothetical protein
MTPRLFLLKFFRFSVTLWPLKTLIFLWEEYETILDFKY